MLSLILLLFVVALDSYELQNQKCLSAVVFVVSSSLLPLKCLNTSLLFTFEQVNNTIKAKCKHKYICTYVYKYKHIFKMFTVLIIVFIVLSPPLFVQAFE